MSSTTLVLVPNFIKMSSVIDGNTCGTILYLLFRYLKSKLLMIGTFFLKMN